MCGIIGYLGPKEPTAIVINGLKRLEYRGYDSFGIASLTQDRIKLFRQVGKIQDFSVSDLDPIESGIAIGHTRWATHGEVNVRNAHPHLSNNKKIAVIHNGIVESYQELRIRLESQGFTFHSDTDTEVIPNLIEFYMKEDHDFEKAFKRSLQEIEGNFAIVAICLGERKICAARRGSPLVLGVGDREYFVASDAPAFMEHTKKVVFLDDDEGVVISDDGYVCFDATTLKAQGHPVETIAWDIEQAKKGDYEHFMIKEIHEQKETIEKAIEQNTSLMEEVTKAIKQAKGVFFVGCGSSYHACVSASYVFSSVAHMHVNVVIASEFRNYHEFLNEKTLVIAVSQSGETADLLDALKTAKTKGVRIMSIVNVMGSTLMRLSEKSIMMNAGPEICVLSTKSYTSQLAILLLLAYSVAGRLDEGKHLIRKAASHVEKVLDENGPKMKDLASRLRSKHDMFLLGRDLAYPSALEGALKIKEVSYVHAEGFAGGELKHGTIALIEKGTPVIALVTEETKRHILGNVTEVKARGAYTIVVNAHENPQYDFFVKVPSMGYADPILMILPIQLLAYHLALERGCDPDKPRNLAKSVTVK